MDVTSKTDSEYALELKQRADQGDDEFAEVRLMELLDSMSEEQYRKYCAKAYASEAWKNEAE